MTDSKDHMIGLVETANDVFRMKAVVANRMVKSMSTEQATPEKLARVIYDWFNWEEPVGLYCESAGPIYALFPFYRTLIVPMYACATEQAFFKLYGISPPAMAELNRQGFLNILYLTTMEEYGKPFYEPILRCGNVGHVLDLALILASVRGIDLVEIMGKCKDTIRTRCEKEGEWSLAQNLKDFSTRAAELWLLGYSDLVLELIECSRPINQVLQDLYVFHVLLADPYLRGLDSVRNIGADFWETLTSHLPSGVGALVPDEKDFVVPADLILTFARQYEFISPADVANPVAYREKLARSENVLLNHEILKKLDQTLKDRRYSEACKTTRELGENVVKNLNREIVKLERWHAIRTDALRVGLVYTGLKLGKIADSQIPPEQPLLAELLSVGGVALSVILGRVAPRLSKLMAGSFLGRESLPYLLWKRRGSRSSLN